MGVDQRLRIIAAAMVTALTAVACGHPASPATNADAPDPGIGHIHGLGIDPSDGTVHIAGHYGLFKVTSAETAERVADRVQDFMGFTVTGPKTFLASGHPGEASSDVPPHLGLIRTTDGGTTWTTVSERGTADFHSLRLAGQNLFAYDSQTGRVRRSEDSGRTWATGAKLQVIDLAANPNESHRVYASTPQGLQVSDDGGESFIAVPGAPVLSHVDSLVKGALIGPAADGQIYTSQNSGRLPGPASAFTAVDPLRLLAATEDGTVLQSENGGKDFSVIFRPVGG
jgi:hypothetical protein